MNQALPDTVVVVDTDVFSQVFVSTSGPNHRELRELLAGLLPVIATQTCAELRAWPLLRNWGSSRCQQLERILSSTTVIPITTEVVDAFVELTVECHRQATHWPRRSIPPIVGWPPRQSHLAGP